MPTFCTPNALAAPPPAAATLVLVCPGTPWGDFAAPPPATAAVWRTAAVPCDLAAPPPATAALPALAVVPAEPAAPPAVARAEPVTGITELPIALAAPPPADFAVPARAGAPAARATPPPAAAAFPACPGTQTEAIAAPPPDDFAVPVGASGPTPGNDSQTTQKPPMAYPASSPSRYPGAHASIRAKNTSYATLSQPYTPGSQTFAATVLTQTKPLCVTSAPRG